MWEKNSVYLVLNKFSDKNANKQPGYIPADSYVLQDYYTCVIYREGFKHTHTIY